MKTTVFVAEESRLRRAITGPALFLFILGDVLGAGVYALVGKVAGEAGGAVWVPLLGALGFAMLTAARYVDSSPLAFPAERRHLAACRFADGIGRCVLRARPLAEASSG